MQLRACEAENPKNHLAILRLDFLRSNLKSNLQILPTETCILKMSNLIWPGLILLCFPVKGEGA
ncbi:hypothetical protein EII16_04160 [Campylobacter rectus]|nr:hypothetical protein EII16_04160 [Campylobacter rectus]